jgi:hypothetical protein
LVPGSDLDHALLAAHSPQCMMALDKPARAGRFRYWPYAMSATGWISSYSDHPNTAIHPVKQSG